MIFLQKLFFVPKWWSIFSTDESLLRHRTHRRRVGLGPCPDLRRRDDAIDRRRRRRRRRR